MSFQQYFSDSDWDQPFFKVLANNDTGSALGHQGGLVVPKELRPFFPDISYSEGSSKAAPDRWIQAQLFLDGRYVGTVQTRYQYQTWGRTRSEESRLTSNLSEILNPAQGGDVIVIQRSVRDLDLFRIQVFTQGNPAFQTMKDKIGEKRWGVLNDEPPMSQQDLEEAEHLLLASDQEELTLFDSNALIQTSRTSRLARSTIFRQRVFRAYDSICAVCNRGFKSPNGRSEVEAGHIVPKRLRGADDVRNGLAMCRSHHWAFDNGLLGIAEDRTILVPEPVQNIEQNFELMRLIGNRIREATPNSRAAASEALAWHRTNVLIG